MSESGSSLTPEQILEVAQRVAGDPHRFAPLADYPHRFATSILGVTLWKKQVEILEAMTKHRRIAVRSGHSVGKTTTAAIAALWWLYAKKGIVVTTAPTKSHVEDVLWREINMRAINSIVPLPGETQLATRRIDATWYAAGITTNTPGAFQGRHHPRLLVIIDEAAGVPEDIHTEISTLATGDENCILMIGNPTSTGGTFYEAFNSPGPWHRIHMSCLDHPNVKSDREIIKGAVTKTWVTEREQVWGKNHPFWYSRVLGEFPAISTRGVIPYMWVQRARDPEQWAKALKEAEDQHIPRVAGLDVARYGENVCVLVVRRGDVIEHIESWHHTNLMETSGIAMKAIKDWDLKSLVVDASGIGAGVADRLQELQAPVLAYNGGHRAFTPASFTNRRSELWWTLRTRFEKKRLWLPDNCNQLERELIAPEYILQSSGRIKVETKEDLLKRIEKSPDYADACTMAFAMDEDPLAQEPEIPDRRRDQTQVLVEVDDNPFQQLPYGF